MPDASDHGRIGHTTGVISGRHDMTYRDHLGRRRTAADRVWPSLLQRMEATLGAPPGAIATDGVLPPLWHWLLFQEWAPPEALGPDGHPRRGGFLPPVHDLPRRMWAGGRVAFTGALRAGDEVTRASEILRIEEKAGGSGRLVFVTVRHEIAGPRGTAVVEEHDIVYRAAEGAAAGPAARAPGPPAGAFGRTIVPDPVLLFRYSALTGNGHRIHYDLDHARGEEGYPGLVVHGPLQATLLADLVRRFRPDARLKSFAFRGRRPAFHGDALRLVGWDEGGVIRLETRDPAGAVCMTAEATPQARVATPG